MNQLSACHTQVWPVSNFAGCSATSRSITEHLVLMNAVSVNVTTTALCTDMAETIPLAKTAVKARILHAILFGLQCRQEEPTFYYCMGLVDSSAVASGNDFFHSTVY